MRGSGMTDGKIRIAEYREHDAAAVEALLRAAFERQDEADLVAALRESGSIWEEWVAIVDSRIVGHIALSRMRAPRDWACLAPVSVQPEWQGRGIGAALTRHGSARAGAPDAPAAIVVLGEPGFYAANGFDLDRAEALQSPFPISHTLIARPGTDWPEERLVYPEAFG